MKMVSILEKKWMVISFVCYKTEKVDLRTFFFWGKGHSIPQRLGKGTKNSSMFKKRLITSFPLTNTVCFNSKFIFNF